MTLRLTGALTAALLLLTAVTTGGLTLAPNTWAEIVLILAGGLVAAWLVLTGGGLASRLAALATALFAALTVQTAASLAWSIAPDLSWVEAGRTAAYFAVLLLGIGLRRRFPDHGGALLGAVALGAVLTGAYALAVKVFTLPVQGQPSLGRLLTPFGYWNATGVAAALGLAPLIWLGSRPTGPARLRALAASGIALLVPVILLSYSRSALAAAAVGVAVVTWGARHRLRALATVGLGLAGGGIVSAWALGTPGISRDIGSRFTANTNHAARVSAGHELGIILLVALAAVWAAALLLTRWADQGRVPVAARDRARRAVAWLPAALVLVAIAGLALSSRGLTGEVSHLVGELTSTKPTVSDNPARLDAVSSSRPDYWRQALAVGNHHRLLGAGPGTFAIARLAYPSAHLIYGGMQLNAHGYVFETYATLGLLGVALSAAFAAAWLAVAVRSVRAKGPGRAGQPGQARDTRVPLLAVCLTFVVSSAIDWTWFIPGLIVPALLCAGWLLGREGADPPIGRPSALRLACAGLAVLLAALAAYETWRPLHASQETAAAARAVAAGDGNAALADARAALAADPDSLTGRQELSAIYWDAGERAQAQAALAAAARIEPDNPQSWVALGGYLLCYAHRPRAAAPLLLRAADLDLVDQFGGADLYNAATSAPGARGLECSRWATP